MKTKETIGIQVSCAPSGHSGYKEYKGPWTHCRSEGTYLLSLALNLARHGHSVTIFEYQWGDQERYPLPDRIKLQKEMNGEYDIYLGTGWDECSSVKARIYCHGWGGDPFSSHLIDYVNKKGIKNHFMMRNSRAFWNNFGDYPYSIYVPIPLVDKIEKKGNFESKKMLWGNRSAFNGDYYIQNSEKVLEFMEKWSGSYKYKVLLWGEIKENAMLFGRTDIIRRFEELRNKNKETELVEPDIGIGHDEFLTELKESKILLDAGHPGEHPQNLEAICMGAIPLIWKKTEHHFQNIIKDDNGKNKSTNINDIYGIDGSNGIDKIMNDEDLYQKYFSALREVTTDHEFDKAYDIFISEIKKKEEKL